MRVDLPSTLSLLTRYVNTRSDVGTKEGRAGLREILEYTRHHVNRHGLGDAKIHEFDDGKKLEPGEPKPANMTIDIGEGKERGIWYAHGDVITADHLYPSNPYHLQKLPGYDEVYGGCGGLDMKAGLTAIVRALPGLEKILKESERSIRIIIPYNEEGDSSGIHEMVRSGQLDGAKWAISTEIAVDSKMQDKGLLLYARPGRARFHVEIDALETGHLGKSRKIPREKQINHRFIMGMLALDEMKLIDPLRENDSRIPESFCLPYKWWTVDPESFSTVGKAIVKVEVFYTDKTLELARIEHAMRNALAAALGVGARVELQTRNTPYIPPWYESPHHPLVQTGLKELSKLLGQPAQATGSHQPASSQYHVSLMAGPPVAEEGVISAEGIPIITIPPQGEGEHTAQEKVSLPYIDDVMIPFLRNMAGTKERLYDENNNA